ncbi:MAG: hypothetical protein A2Y58_00275 [Chloroflexi bacterium RBG_13_51_52]|nr:MAG: hypothetical protein A2Y58_00275 [Chloroflexi bacterium RBG_13_51_52]
MKVVGRVTPLIRRYVGSPIIRVAESGINEPLLRKVVGFLGIALPFVLLVWGFFICGWHVQDSLSDYYSLRTRDAFVGILFVIGWVLFAYSGYEKMDSIAGKLAWIFALCVALFPNSGSKWEGIVHFSSASCLFAVFAFFSLFLFTKSEDSRKGFKNTIADFRMGGAKKVKSMDGEKWKRKRNRNIIYVICGYTIVVCLILAALYEFLWQDTALSVIKPTLILEIIMVWTFAFSWLIKGDTFWQDKEKQQE